MVSINNEKFTIESEKLKDNSKIVLLGDLHITKKTEYDMLDSIIERVSLERPDSISLVGDLVYKIDDFDDTNIYSKLNYFIKELSNHFPILIVPGNHDIKKGKKYSVRDINCLSSISNVEVLNNTQTSLNGMVYTGFSPRIETYYNNHKDKWFEYYVEDFINCFFSLSESNYNIFLTHSPLVSTNEEVINALRDWYNKIDLVLCGHMHDGLIPRFMQDMGLFLPDKGITAYDEKTFSKGFSFTNKTRGMHEINNFKLIITRGIRKWVKDCLIHNTFDSVSSHDITTITLKK